MKGNSIATLPPLLCRRSTFLVHRLTLNPSPLYYDTSLNLPPWCMERGNIKTHWGSFLIDLLLRLNFSDFNSYHYPKSKSISQIHKILTRWNSCGFSFISFFFF